MVTKVKICGLKTEATLDAALDGGADFVGLNFYPPSPRSLPTAVARRLADRARGRARSVAVLVDPDDARLEEITGEVEPDLIQLHGHETPERVREIRQRFGRPVIKAITVATDAEVAGAKAYYSAADLLLFDARAPASLADALPGGNGLSFDWRLLADLQHKLDFMLSGGLNPANVAEAIRLVRPHVVDVSSGVESAFGHKSIDLIRRFLAAAKGAPVIA
jgi:phosphoribosylanthranilate isomerase